MTLTGGAVEVRQQGSGQMSLPELSEEVQSLLCLSGERYALT